MRKKKCLKKLREILKCWQLYAMLLPFLIFIAVFKYGPMYGIQIAFRNFNFADGITGSEWVGLKWFKYLFGSKQFPILFRNTLLLGLYELCTYPLPIILALIIHNIPSRKFKRMVQTITYMPHFISTVVVVGMLSAFTSVNSGWINALIEALGGTAIDFMGTPKYFRHLYIWSGEWAGIGWGSIVFLAALTAVNPELHEAASIDGANKFKRVIYIDLPCIIPTIAIMLILRCGNILSVGFEKIYLMQNDLNKAVSSVFATYSYEMGLGSGKFSFSTAISLFSNTINLIMLTSVNRISRRLSGSSLW